MTCTKTCTAPGEGANPVTLRCARDGEHRWHFDRFHGAHWRVEGNQVVVRPTVNVLYNLDDPLPPAAPSSPPRTPTTWCAGSPPRRRP
jgi:hypothetical protein